MRISDWSSDVCSSDLAMNHGRHVDRVDRRYMESCGGMHRYFTRMHELLRDADGRPPQCDGHGEISGAYAQERRKGSMDRARDRTSVVRGKSVPVRVNPGGRRIHKKKK